MHYTDHALLSAKKFDCKYEDTLQLHKLMDSSKLFFPKAQHRLFSHNQWFVYVLTELIGDTVKNTKNGKLLSTRDILWEHLREDHNGHTPSLQDWLSNLIFKVTPEGSKWFNRVNQKDIEMLKKIKEHD